MFLFFFFFFNDTATTEIYTLSLHDALPIWFHLTGSSTAHRRPRTFFRRRTMRDAVASLRRHGHPHLDRRAFDPAVRRVLRLARRTSNRATRRRPPLSRVPEGSPGPP